MKDIVIYTAELQRLLYIQNIITLLKYKDFFPKQDILTLMNCTGFFPVSDIVTLLNVKDSFPKLIK